MSSLFEKAQDARVVVLGVGNTLLSDEGVGVRVVRRVAEDCDTPGVVFVDGGVGGYGLVDAFIAGSRVIVVDAIDARRPPGEVLVFGPEQLAEQEAGTLSSLHGVGVLDVHRLAAALGHRPPTTIVGIQVATIEPGEDLSEAVEKALPRAIEAVHAAIASAPADSGQEPPAAAPNEDNEGSRP